MNIRNKTRHCLKNAKAWSKVAIRSAKAALLSRSERRQGSFPGISAACVGAGLTAAALFLAPVFLHAAGDSPTTLDQWLAQAMDKNAGILASKAKVAMAEAELRNVRFEVARQVVACWNEIDDQQKAIALAEGKEGAVAKGTLIDLKAKLARAQMELQFLGGQAPPATSASLAPSTAPARVQAPLQIPHGLGLEKARQALRQFTRLEFVETPLKDVVEYLEDQHQVNIQIDGSALPDEKQRMPITTNIAGISLAAAFQRLEDEKFGELKFVVRDYGVFLTTPTRAQEAGYIPVADFLSLRKGVSPEDLREAQERLAQLIKALEAGGTESEVAKLRGRLGEFMYVWDKEETAAQWKEASKWLDRRGKPDPPKKKPAAARKAGGVAPQTVPPPGTEPPVKPSEPTNQPRRNDDPFAP